MPFCSYFRTTAPLPQPKAAIPCRTTKPDNAASMSNTVSKFSRVSRMHSKRTSLSTSRSFPSRNLDTASRGFGTPLPALYEMFEYQDPLHLTWPMPMSAKTPCKSPPADAHFQLPVKSTCPFSSTYSSGGRGTNLSAEAKESAS